MLNAMGWTYENVFSMGFLRSLDLPLAARLDVVFVVFVAAPELVCELFEAGRVETRNC